MADDSIPSTTNTAPGESETRRAFTFRGLTALAGAFLPGRAAKAAPQGAAFSNGAVGDSVISAALRRHPFEKMAEKELPVEIRCCVVDMNAMPNMTIPDWQWIVSTRLNQKLGLSEKYNPEEFQQYRNWVEASMKASRPANWKREIVLHDKKGSRKAVISAIFLPRWGGTVKQYAAYLSGLDATTFKASKCDRTIDHRTLTEWMALHEFGHLNGRYNNAMIRDSGDYMLARHKQEMAADAFATLATLKACGKKGVAVAQLMMDTRLAVAFNAAALYEEGFLQNKDIVAKIAVGEYSPTISACYLTQNAIRAAIEYYTVHSDEVKKATAGELMAVADQIVASQSLGKEQLAMLAGTLKQGRLGVDAVPESERLAVALANGSLDEISAQMPGLLEDMVLAHERILGHAIERKPSMGSPPSARGISRRDFLAKAGNPNAPRRDIGG